MRWTFAAMLAVSLGACGQTSEIEIDDVWARDTIGSTANAAVYMTIASPAADRLVGASAPIAARTDLMTMTAKDGAMSMVYLDGIEIPANDPVSLDPGGLHVWLDGLTQPLRAGQAVPLVLEFEKAGRREVVVSIIEPAAAPPMSGMGM